MIKIRGLTKRYGDFEALKGIDLDVAPGEFLVVLGPSGAGKSTLLRCINRLAEPTQGEVYIDGVLARSDSASLRKLRLQVAMIFQHYNVVPRLSVEKNVLTGRLGAMPAVLSWLQMFPSKDVAIARECLRRVEIEDKAQLRTDTLSGGQKQRVGIARALAQQPKIILADEPVASLDPKTSRTVLNYLKQASRDLGISVVCNLHQIEYAREFGERIVGVSAGRVVFEGGPADLTDDVLHRIYPGLDEGPAASSSPARAEPVHGLGQLALEEA
ncbi:MAG: phosphonate ABC transporter ATP-binding protein [Pseudomonadota bacterium]